MTGNTIGAIHYHTVPSPAASQHTSPSSGHDFLKTHKTALETRMGNLRIVYLNFNIT
ncbi:unnamed protein product, partial [Coregonus sp. 'balchen']